MARREVVLGEGISDTHYTLITCMIHAKSTSETTPKSPASTTLPLPSLLASTYSSDYDFLDKDSDPDRDLDNNYCALSETEVWEEELVDSFGKSTTKNT